FKFLICENLKAMGYKFEWSTCRVSSIQKRYRIILCASKGEELIEDVDLEPRLLTLYPLARNTSCRFCVYIFGLKVAVTATFNPVKATQINFRKIRQKPSKSTA
ncbi:MAG: hypothetical protein SWZ49_02080, partial [Cyanobacteriota bacterium]|nr:hypothetical protein [Cyanobacteriota bacterium]